MTQNDLSKAFYRLTGLVLAIPLVVGCAGGFAKDVSVTKLSTEPASARCSLEGKEYSKMVITPARVILPKEAAPVRVSCSRAGHKPFQTALKPLFNERILNNFLLMSSFGMLIDLMNGHESKYPDRVHLNLEPIMFTDANARDQWFAKYRAHVTRKWNRIVSDVSDRCNEASGEQGNCSAGVKDVQLKRVRALEMVEQRRRGAQVRNNNMAAQPVPLDVPGKTKPAEDDRPK